MSSDKDSKTEKPTPKRIEEARKEGQIARSPDLVAWVSVLATFSVLEMTVRNAAKVMNRTMYKMSDLIAKPDMGPAMKFAIETMRDAFVAIAPLALAFMVIGIVGHFAQVRFVLAFKAIKPDFKKINPMSGFKRMFGSQGLFNVAKQATKCAVLGYIAYRTLYTTGTSLARNGPYPMGEIITVTVKAVSTFIRQGAFAAIIISLADYAFQRHKINKGLKMTKQQVKEESKQQDVSPEIRSKIRRKQMQMSRNRMMSAINDADVVVVNPVHIAVAIQYDPQKGAPKVVAKGAGFVAEKIREKAEEAKVPMVQDIPLARTLHKACEVDDEIPHELFEAVAKLLAFLFALKARGRSSGFHKMPGTPELEDVDRKEAAERAKSRFGPSSSDIVPI